jgi:hypothetical protein
LSQWSRTTLVFERHSVRISDGTPAILNKLFRNVGTDVRKTGLEGECNVLKATLVRNFYVNIGRAACESWSATSNFGINSAFGLGPRRTTKKLDGVVRLQDFPNAAVSIRTRPVGIEKQINILYNFGC